MPLIRQLVGVRANDSSLPTLQRDAIIDSRTVGLFDALSKYAYPTGAGSAPAGAPIKDLVRGAPDSVVGASPITHDGLGFYFNMAQQAINLGANWKVPNVNHFAFCVWLKVIPGPYVVTPLAIMGYKDSANNRYQYGMFINTNTGTGNMSALLFQANGGTTQVNGNLQDAVHQVVFEYDNSTGTPVFKIYIDGVLVTPNTSSPGTTYPVLPGVNDKPILGQYTGASLAGTFKGTIYRAWLQRLDTPGEALASIVATDYANNRPRFAA